MGGSVLGSKNTREWTDIHELPGMANKIKPGYIAVNRKGDLMYMKTGKIKKPELKDGYYRYTWTNGEHRYSVMIHRLVAMAYVDGYAHGLMVDHLDTVRTNNDYRNLIWTTQKQNSNNPKTIKKLYQARVRGSRRVTAYFFDGKPFRMFDSLKEAAAALHLPKLPLQETAIRREGVKHCYGLLWKSTPCTDTPKDLTRKEYTLGKNMPAFMTITARDGKQYLTSGYKSIADYLGVTSGVVKKALETGEPCKGWCLSPMSCREYWQSRNPEMFA